MHRCELIGAKVLSFDGLEVSLEMEDGKKVTMSYCPWTERLEVDDKEVYMCECGLE